MIKVILLSFLLLSLVGCGKIRHEVSGSAKVEGTTAIWISFRLMYDELVFICGDIYPVESDDFLNCKKKAMKKITNLLEINETL